MPFNPSIAVLLPCHSINYLNQALESIDNQTIAKDLFEVLIIIDRVSDIQVSEMASKLSMNFRTLVSPKPGIVAALNFGIENTSAELIARMDEDDLMYSDRLFLQKAFLDENQDFAAVGGQLELIDDKNSTLGFSIYPKALKVNSPDTLVRSPLPHPGTMFRRGSVVRVGGYRDFLPEDWDLWVRLNESSKIGNLEKVVLKYRIHGRQLSRQEEYALPRGGRLVAMSHVARVAGVKDGPRINQTTEEWITDLELNPRFQLVSRQPKFDRQKEKRFSSLNAQRNSLESRLITLFVFLRKDFSRHLPIVIRTLLHKIRMKI